VKALARAHRWQRLLEGGRYRSLRELAATEGVDRSCVGRLLWLTLLAPYLVGAMLNGRQSSQLQLPASTEPFPVEWERQAKSLVREP
jgi:hypothetical protein